MKVLVPIKRVVDPYIRVRVRRDGSGVETDGVKMAMNPFCEIAVEEAVRMKADGKISEVVAVSIGSDKSVEILRTAIAMGVDRIIHVPAPEQEPQPLGIAKILNKLVDDEKPDMVLMGKQAIDGDYNQTGQILSGLMGGAIATFVSKLEVLDDGVRAIREVDAGLETLKLSFPAVVTVDLRLNEPRKPTMPNMIKAKKADVETRTIQDLGVSLPSQLEVLEVMPPPEREGGELVNSVDELVEKLKQAEVL